MMYIFHSYDAWSSLDSGPCEHDCIMQLFRTFQLHFRYSNLPILQKKYIISVPVTGKVTEEHWTRDAHDQQ